MVKFNLKFLELTKSNRLEMVNWLFLHETTFSGDSASIFKPDGNTFYFFFTPDVRVPVEKQLIDGVTATYWSKKVNGTWMVGAREARPE